jgi:anaerobic magnesium-protoporphyrin IX monomethyl ester cyclase
VHYFKKKTKVGLISLKSGDGCVPMGLVYIGTYLKKHGIDVQIIDANFEDPYQTVMRNRFDLLGISAMTVHYGRAVNLARLIKTVKKTPIIIGGVHISTLPVSFEDCFDTAIIGEGEKIFLDMAKYGLVKGLVKGEPIENLDDLPHPDWSLVNKRYFDKVPSTTFGEFGIEGNILTSRGCPYKCRFCSTTQFWSKLRFHSADYVVDEINNLINNLNVNLIQIWDDLFTINIPRLIELKAKLKLNKKIKFNCQPRPNLVNDGLCKVLKDMNISIGIFGFESGSDKVLGYLKRNTVTVQQNMDVVRMFRKHKIGVQGSVVLGSPGETIKDMYKTLDFVNFCIKEKVQRLWSFILMPYPGTEMWKITSTTDWDSLNCQNVDNPMLLDKSVDRKEFKKVFTLIKNKTLGFRWGKIFSFARNNPIQSLCCALKAPLQTLSLLTRKEDV